MDIDREIQGVHDRYWDVQSQRALGKTVLLVEGDDDRIVIEGILNARRRTWQTSVSVSVAGGRKQVLSRLSDHRFRHAYGLIDRDTWTRVEVTEQMREHPNLYVTEGWCIENLFLDPAWLEERYPSSASRIAPERERWVRAGALWWTLQRAREGQQRWQEALRWTYGEPRADIDTSSPEALTGALVQAISQQTRDAARFDVDAIAETFDRRCREVLALPQHEQWRVGVHGKVAFTQLLVPALPQGAYQMSATDRLVDLADHLGRPPPFDRLVALLLP